MDDRLARDRDDLETVLTRGAAAAGSYLAGLGTAPPLPVARPPAPTPLPTDGIGAAAALAMIERDWLPAMAAMSGPRFWGYVTGGTTPAAIAGDWLAAAIDQNPASNEGAAAELERRTTAWIGELLGFGPAQHGVFTTGATMANLAGLALARRWAAQRRGVDVDEGGLTGLTAPRVLAACAHSSIGKSLALLGLGRSCLEPLPRLPGREAVDVAALGEILDRSLGDQARAGTPREPEGAGRPVVVVASAGTLNTGDVDDLAAMGELRDRHGFWLHVDAAFGGFGALDPDVAPRLAGIEAADSITVDLHKWMNVPYDSAVAYTRHPGLRVPVFGNVGAYPYGPDDEVPFVHLGPENSRRLRALPAYAALLAYGRAGHADIVRRNIAQARAFAARVEAMPGARLLAPVRLNVVCFATERPAPEVLGALAGAALLTPTTYGGGPAIRAAFSNWRITEADVDRVADALREILR